MSRMYFEVLDEKRREILRRAGGVAEGAVLGGGTALALQMGHRKSYDLDWFLEEQIEPGLLEKVNEILKGYQVRPVVDSRSELSVIIDGEIRVTWLKFPFPALHELVKIERAMMYSVADLVSNKAYVIGRRGEWKDYVDMYFVLVKMKLEVDRVIGEAKQRFGGNFDEKLFWEQLVYWKDLRDFEIGYVEEVVAKEIIQKYFEELAQKRFG